MAFERTSEGVKSRLADVADALGRTPEYRQLAPKDQDKLLRRHVAEAFVSRICAENGLDAPGKLAHASAYFAQMLGNPAGKSAKVSPAKFARQVSVAEQARGKKFLDLLVEDARRNGMNRTVDVTLDLQQPQFQRFVSKQVRQMIIGPLVAGSEMTTGMAGKPANVSGNFWRDFTGGGTAEYWLDDGKGSVEKLSAKNENDARASTGKLLRFIDWKDGDTVKVLTHLASQTLSSVVLAMINQPFFDGRKKFAPLRTSQGQPLALCLSPLVKFTFKKLEDGKIALHYEGTIAPSEKIDANKKNAAKVQDDQGGNWKPLVNADYSLKINFRIECDPNVGWTMHDPRIQARNLHRIAE